MDYDPTSGTARVGAGLREVRERLGWKLPDVAEALRIRQEYLTAIEQGDLTPLPGPAYRAGFVRSYARILGLDGEEILNRFRNAGGLGEVQKTGLNFLASVPDRGVPKGAIVLLGVVVVLAIYGLWYYYTETERHMAAQVPEIPAQLAPLATPPIVSPAPAQAPVKAATTAPAPAKPPTAATVTTPATTPPAPATPPAMPATTPPATTQPAPVTPAATATAPVTPPASPAAQSPAPAAPAATPPGAGMVITATQDAWVEVKDASGNILFSKVLHAGDSWPVPQEAGLTMTTGNAGGTEITTNGKAGAPLGAAGVVLHNYQLTPATAAQGTK